jgi:hypothetical protein
MSGRIAIAKTKSTPQTRFKLVRTRKVSVRICLQ